jgi:hypothetical protein
MELLQRAALRPGPADNHQSHADTHALFIKSVEFEGLDPEMQDKFFTHLALTQEAMQAPPQPIEPRVGLQIRSTLGPTATGELLRRAGVEVPAEAMTEPPLESVVFDSIDKLDAEGEDADPMAQAERQAAIMKTEAQAELARAQALAALRGNREQVRK